MWFKRRSSWDFGAVFALQNKHTKKYLATNKKEMVTNQKATTNTHGKNPKQNLTANSWDEKSAMYAYPYITVVLVHGQNFNTTTSKQEVWYQCLWFFHSPKNFHFC